MGRHAGHRFEMFTVRGSQARGNHMNRMLVTGVERRSEPRVPTFPRIRAGKPDRAGYESREG